MLLNEDLLVDFKAVPLVKRELKLKHTDDLFQTLCDSWQNNVKHVEPFPFARGTYIRQWYEMRHVTCPYISYVSYIELLRAFAMLLWKVLRDNSALNSALLLLKLFVIFTVHRLEWNFDIRTILFFRGFVAHLDVYLKGGFRWVVGQDACVRAV